MRTEDGSIIQQCLEGDSAMFGFLVDKYKRSVYALAYSKVNNFHDAQDITQEVFIKAFRNLHTLKSWDNFMGWLSRITLNTCKSWIRSASRRPDSEFVEDKKQDISYSYMKSYHEDNLFESIKEALDSLPEVYSQVLTLQYFGGMSVNEIAGFLSVSPSTIDRRISEAKTRLKEEMLTMINNVSKSYELPSAFTFHIVEIVKNIRIHPISPTKALPWGLSLTAGIIATILSFGVNLNSLDKSESMIGSLSQGASKVLNVGEYPVDVMKISDIPFISNQQMNGNGLGSVVPSLQNALFMSPQAGDTWTRKADMPTGRGGLNTCAINGKIYAIGGVTWDDAGNQKSLSTVEEYDPKANTWTKKSDISTSRFFFAACEVNRKIYVIGGLNTADGNFKDLQTVEEYDPDIDKWTPKADMPTSRYWLSASAVNGKIYAIGGLTVDMVALSTVEEYDPAIDKWTRKTDLPRQIHTLSTNAVNNKIYGIGGVDNGVLLSTVYEYDPLLDSWTRKADMPTARTRACSSAVNGRIYAIGGYDRIKQIDLTSVEEYDPIADKWTKKTDMPECAEDHACSAVDGKIYVIGGSNNPKLVEEYETGFADESINLKGKLPTTWGDLRTASKK
jgi:RNA polymerase sigma factor (sigma-70 family)